MPPDPSRTTTAGRVFNDLRSRAKRDGRSTDELMVFYVLERFLYRVTQSHYADRLVLKGGLLLAALDARRATRDADLLGLDLDGSAQHVMTMVRDILVLECDDGKARANLVLDINFGDPVTPGAVPIEFPQLLGGGTFHLLGYPVQTVLAEKVTTMLALGDLNTRDRDWADVWSLTGSHDLAGDSVQEAVTRTAAYRGVRLRPLSRAIDRLPQLRRSSYKAWRARQPSAMPSYPDDFVELVRATIDFADPILTRQAGGRNWFAATRSWWN